MNLIDIFNLVKQQGYYLTGQDLGRDLDLLELNAIRLYIDCQTWAYSQFDQPKFKELRPRDGQEYLNYLKCDLTHLKLESITKLEPDGSYWSGLGQCKLYLYVFRENQFKLPTDGDPFLMINDQGMGYEHTIISDGLMIDIHNGLENPTTISDLILQISYQNVILIPNHYLCSV